MDAFIKPQNTTNFSIRKMNINDLGTAISWAALEGWNPGLYDADPFYSADPEGFLIGELDGKAAATISVVKYDQSFGFLGFYIVKPELRGQGYGMRIWNAGMEYLRGINTGLDGVVAQQENYKKSGFRFAYRNIRFEGIASGNLCSDVISLQDIPFEELLSYDANLFPAERSRFLKKWISQPEAKAFCILNGSRLSGYGVIRKCRRGFKIGPLFADNFERAEKLFDSMTGTIKGETFFLDVPEVNKDALKLAHNNSMTQSFETARMYTGKFPQIDPNKIFGVTTFELG